MKVYIVIYLQNIVESVWSSHELAKSAIFYHMNNIRDRDDYVIIEREVNTATHKD